MLEAMMFFSRGLFSFFGMLVVISAFVVFVVTFLVLYRGRSSDEPRTLLPLLLCPFALSLMGLLSGLIRQFATIGFSDGRSDSGVTIPVVAEIISELLVFPFIGLALTAPSYLIVVGSILIQLFKKPAPTVQ